MTHPCVVTLDLAGEELGGGLGDVGGVLGGGGGLGGPLGSGDGLGGGLERGHRARLVGAMRLLGVEIGRAHV